jgi:hypothetical protein
MIDDVRVCDTQTNARRTAGVEEQLRRALPNLDHSLSNCGVKSWWHLESLEKVSRCEKRG